MFNDEELFDIATISDEPTMLRIKDIKNNPTETEGMLLKVIKENLEYIAGGHQPMPFDGYECTDVAFRPKQTENKVTCTPMSDEEVDNMRVAIVARLVSLGYEVLKSYHQKTEHFNGIWFKVIGPDRQYAYLYQRLEFVNHIMLDSSSVHTNKP